MKEIGVQFFRGYKISEDTYIIAIISYLTY
jgi:hypothetical protein